MKNLSNILIAAIFSGAATTAFANDRVNCLSNLAKSWDPAARLYTDRKDLGKVGFVINMQQQYTVGSGETKISPSFPKEAIMVADTKKQTLAFYSLFATDPALSKAKEELVKSDGVTTVTFPPSFIINTAHSETAAAHKKFMDDVRSCQLR